MSKVKSNWLVGLSVLIGLISPLGGRAQVGPYVYNGGVPVTPPTYPTAQTAGLATNAIFVNQTLLIPNQNQVIISTNGDGIAPANIAGTYTYAYTNSSGGYSVYTLPGSTNVLVYAAAAGNFASAGWNLAPFIEIAAGGVSFNYSTPFPPASVAGKWKDADNNYGGSLSATFGAAPTTLSGASSGELPYNGYLVRNRLYQNLLNGQCTKILFLGDSYAGAPFGNANGLGSTAEPWPNKLSADVFQAAHNWNANGPFSGTYYTPPQIFPQWANLSGNWNDPNINLTPYSPFIGLWFSPWAGGQISYGPYTNVNLVSFMWWTTPQGGNNLILYTNGVAIKAVNGFGATTNSMYTNIVVPTGTYTLAMGTTVSANTNTIFGATAWNTTNGVAIFYTQAGGTTPQNILQAVPAYTNFWTAISPDIVIYLNVHGPSDTPAIAMSTFDAMQQAINGSFTNKNALWCFVGSAYGGGTPLPADSGAYLNMIYYNLCTESNWTYLDACAPAYDWTNLLSSDGVHPNLIGQAWGAAKIEQQIGLVGQSDPSEALLSTYAAQFFNYGSTNYQPSTWSPYPGQWIMRGSNGAGYIITQQFTNRFF